MVSKLLKPACALAALCLAQITFAGTITGGDLLTDSGATFLENRLGLGDLDFTNISDLSAGASSSTWHNDVRGYTNIISIYDVSFQGNNYLIGGYSTIGHDGMGWFSNDDTKNATANNFLFNLTLGIVHNTQDTPWGRNFDQVDDEGFFATFGGGGGVGRMDRYSEFDLYGGSEDLGSDTYEMYPSISANPLTGEGYSYGGTEHLLGTGVSGYQEITVTGLESYVFNPAAPMPLRVPEPAMFALLALGLAAVGVSNKRKNA